MADYVIRATAAEDQRSDRGSQTGPQYKSRGYGCSGTADDSGCYDGI